MRSVDEACKSISDHFEMVVRELGQEDYRDVLENTISDLESKLDCVREEMEAEGID